MQVFVIVPWDLAGVLHERLRGHFRSDRSVQVVVDRRSWGKAPRNAIEDRPLVKASDVTPRLPAFTAPYRERLAFRYLREQATLDRDAENIRLIESFQAGELLALDVLYTRDFDHVYSVLSLVLDDAGDAEELTQRTWDLVHQRLERF